MITWWQWAILVALAYCVYYLEKIRELLGWLMLLQAHKDPENDVAKNFLEERREKMMLQVERPFTGWLVWWWRRS